MGSLGWRAVLTLVVLAVASAAAAQGRGPSAEADVVVKTNLQTTPEHTKMYVSTLQRYARMCLAGLTSRREAAASDPLQDGAAQYRLTVVHAGSVAVGNKAEIGRPMERSSPSVHYLLTRQKGTFGFELSRWTGTAYTSTDKWTSSFATTHQSVIPSGVTRSDISKWRKTAIMRTYPEAVKDGILNHILPIRVVRTVGPPGGEQNVVLAVTNQALWPLKAAKIGITWSDTRPRQAYRYHADLNYSGLLMPGEKTTLQGKAKVWNISYYYELAMPTQITAMPTFDPLRGPVWVRRHVGLMKEAGTRPAALRLVERAMGRLTPLEMKVAAEALIELLAHDAPQSEADVPKDARRLLEQIGQPAVPFLADALAHDNPGMRLGAACVFQKIKVTDPTVIDRLRTALKDACEPVRAAAAKALEAGGVKAEAEPDPEPDATQQQDPKVSETDSKGGLP